MQIMLQTQTILTMQVKQLTKIMQVTQLMRHAGRRSPLNTSLRSPKGQVKPYEHSTACQGTVADYQSRYIITVVRTMHWPVIAVVAL